MVTLREIRRYAHEVARRFKPQRIVLFGSYAYGTPNEDSDVDLLVVMRHRGATYSQATRIRCAVEPPFALDLLVRSPEELKKRLKLGDYLIREIVERGKVLYDASNKGVGAKSRGGLPLRAARTQSRHGSKLRHRVLSLPAVR